MANVNVTSGGIPERTLTLQYKSLNNEKSSNTPSVAGGNEIKLYAESIKEVFKKEPQFQSIQKGEKDHFKGDETLVVDTMNAKHTFEITAYVYAKGDNSSNDRADGGKIIHSLPPYNSPAGDGDLRNGDGTATVSGEVIPVGEPGKAQPLGDEGIDFDSEVIKPKDGKDVGEPLDRGENKDYTIDYSRGEITINESAINGDSPPIASKEEQVKGPFGVFDLGPRTVITDDLKVEYDFEVSAQNIASQIRRMAQLGNPFVMRLDEKTITAPDGEKDARGFLVTPKAVNIISESGNPARYKVELELRKGGPKR